MFTLIWSSIPSQVKGYGLIGLLVMALAWFQSNQRAELESTINDLQQDKSRLEDTIEARDREIHELVASRLVEEGLREIITWQTKRYEALSLEYQHYRSSAMDSVLDMSEEERIKGSEVDVLWDLYLRYKK